MSGVLIERGRAGISGNCALANPTCQLVRFSRFLGSYPILDVLVGVKLLSLIILADLSKNVLTLFFSIEPDDLCRGLRVGVSCSALSLRLENSGEGVCLEYSLRVPVEGE